MLGERAKAKTRAPRLVLLYTRVSHPSRSPRSCFCAKKNKKIDFTSAANWLIEFHQRIEWVFSFKFKVGLLSHLSLNIITWFYYSLSHCDLQNVPHGGCLHPVLSWNTSEPEETCHPRPDRGQETVTPEKKTSIHVTHQQLLLLLSVQNPNCESTRYIALVFCSSYFVEEYLNVIILTWVDAALNVIPHNALKPNPAATESVTKSTPTNPRAPWDLIGSHQRFRVMHA